MKPTDSTSASGDVSANDGPDSSDRRPTTSSVIQGPAGRSGGRRWAWFVVAGLLFLVAVVGLAGLRSYGDLAAQRQRAAELEEQIRATQERVRELDRRLELLRDDPDLLEHLARESLGLVAPGDIVLLLPDARADNRHE